MLANPFYSTSFSLLVSMNSVISLLGRLIDFCHCCSRPVKVTVEAVAGNLPGLVGTQLTYSHAHQNTAQVCFAMTHC